MKIGKGTILGVVLAVIVIGVDLIFFLGDRIFYFLLGIGVFIGTVPFVIEIILKNKEEKEKNEMFLEFSRDLVESVKAGTPISRSIINLKNKDYGPLSRHIEKLANQISIGIPVKSALGIFSRDVDIDVVKRAVGLIIEAEKAGGEIENILESVSESVNETEKLKKERKAAVYSLIVQGYIIFFIFVIIMLIMQFKILPMTSEVAKIGEGVEGGILGFGGGGEQEDLTQPLLFLLVSQGLFAGLVIGKLAEGKVKAGIKHSFILVALSLLVYTGVKAFI
jgi:flagellar protein FlaJ